MTEGRPAGMTRGETGGPDSQNNEYARFDGGRAVENVGGHQRAVFGEGMGQGLGELAVSEGITCCDHLRRWSIRIMIYPSRSTT